MIKINKELVYEKVGKEIITKDLKNNNIFFNESASEVFKMIDIGESIEQFIKSYDLNEFEEKVAIKEIKDIIKQLIKQGVLYES